MDLALRNTINANRDFKCVVKQIHYLDIRQRAALERLTSLSEKYITLMKEVSVINNRPSNTTGSTSCKPILVGPTIISTISKEGINATKSPRSICRDSITPVNSQNGQDEQITASIFEVHPERLANVLMTLEQDIRVAEDEVYELSSSRIALLQGI
eukprot:Tbor_TRINITY_DN5280_c0_g1::TRINITY_DN5280_c0_g1_i1::g.16717::m.16717